MHQEFCFYFTLVPSHPLGAWGPYQKILEKVWSFTPLGPPPILVFFRKFTPIMFLKIASLMAETNFALGPTAKTNKYPLILVIICPELGGGE